MFGKKQDQNSFAIQAANHSQVLTQANLIDDLLKATEANFPTPPDKLLFGREDEEWGEITRADSIVDAEFRELDLDGQAKIKLGNFFSHATKLATNSNNMSNTYVMKMNPQMAKGITNGSYSMMNSTEGGIRGVVVDSKTQKIVGQSSFVKGSPNPAALATLGFQVLTMVTAQQHLSDINKQLKEVTTRLDKITDLLEQEVVTKVKSTLKFLESKYQLVIEGKIDNAWVNPFLNRLLAIEGELNNATETLKNRLEAKFKDYLTKKVESSDLLFFQLNNNIGQFEELVVEYNKFSEAYLMSLWARGLTAQIGFLISSNQDIAINQLQEVVVDLSWFRKHEANFLAEVKNKEAKLKEKSSDLASKVTEKALQLRAEMGLVEKEIKHRVEETYDFVQEASQTELCLLIELDEREQVKKVCKLLSASQYHTTVIY